MIVIHESNDCKLINHERGLREYQNSDGKLVKYKLSETLFNNFKVKRKDNNNPESNDPEVTKIKEFLTECKLKNLFTTIPESNVESIKNENIKLMNKFYSLTNEFGQFHGENNLNQGVITKINTEEYLIPPKCRFFNKSVDKIQDFLSIDEKFDFIVIDPPFRCRYIKRLKKTCQQKSYQMMTNEDILKIPLQNYTHKNSIIVIWCTNSDTHEKFIRSDIMNAWHLKLIGTWKWVKIDKCGETFCPFNGSKKPYEKVFIAAHTDSDKTSLGDDLMIFSHPSSIHSHKPPLLDLFKGSLPTEPKCLEIFARSLYEHFTSVGLECLKLQNKMLFDMS
ncbi:N(6)-adenine-specific methyltransferase METTL4 [Chironomus tepperi]|uniref:N(6)-adenine-specific methyltransferase METTL4 n=1 Tax=Chironomus tepperi TaxID=113505 RepID=UPI00391FB892